MASPASQHVPHIHTPQTTTACLPLPAPSTQVDEVKQVMSDNIEKVLSRGEKLDLLVDKTDNLMFEVTRSGEQVWDKCQQALPRP